MQVDQARLLNQVQGTSLDEIRVVQEYPDIFLEDLPGMPLDRDIEFIIDLLPGTPPISKRHSWRGTYYQMHMSSYCYIPSCQGT
jgi:hypothetical protein